MVCFCEPVLNVIVKRYVTTRTFPSCQDLHLVIALSPFVNHSRFTKCPPSGNVRIRPFEHSGSCQDDSNGVGMDEFPEFSSFHPSVQHRSIARMVAISSSLRFLRSMIMLHHE
jgi:hypothetical protein